MANNPFELPSASEKLSSKFIFDALKHQQQKPTHPPVSEEVKEVTAQMVTEMAEESKQVLVEEVELPLGEPEPVTAEPKTPFAPLAFDAGKKYFRIGEVSQLIGVEAYVLRYWESEFSNIRPVKSRSGQRVYSRKDVETLHLIKHLLYVEKFSIKGAKKKLLEKRKETTELKASPDLQRRDAKLKTVIADLKELIHFIKNDPGTI